MRNPYIGKGRTELRNAMMRLKGADIYTPRAAVQIDDAFKATEAAMPQGMQASYKQQRDESLSKLDSNFRGDMSGIRSNQEYGDLIVDNIADQRQTLSNSEEAGLSALIDTIVTGGMGNRMADIRYLNRALIDAEEVVKYRDTAKAAFKSAKVPNSRFNDEVGLIGADQVGEEVPELGPMLKVPFADTKVSAPYIAPDGRRVHTNVVKNPVTGVEQIMPFIDPENTSTALVSPIGEVRGSDIEATEAAQLYLLKLMGTNARQNAGANGTPVWHSDFKANIGGREVQIDGQARISSDIGKDTTNIPVFMNVRPGTNGKRTFYPSTQAGQADLVTDVKNTIRDERKKRSNGNSIIKAVDAANGKTLQTPTSVQAVGKVLRNDPNRVTNKSEIYDNLMMTGYDRDQQVYGNKANTTVTMPSTAHIVNLNVAKDLALNHPNNKMIVGSNSGGTRPFQGEAYNAKVQAIFNLNDNVRGVPLTEDIYSKPEWANVYQAL